MASDDITFPLPEAKYSGKRFFSSSVIRAQKMYNMLPSCTCKVSLSTYYKYQPKKFCLQGRIPFQQSCCERCQNFEALIDEMSKYMVGILCTLANCVDSSVCVYIMHTSQKLTVFYEFVSWPENQGILFFFIFPKHCK